MSKQIPTAIGILIILLFVGLVSASVFLLSQEDEETVLLKEEIEFKEENVEIFEVSLPVIILDISFRENEHKDLSLYNRSVKGRLEDNKGRSFNFVYSRDIDRNDATIPGWDKHYFYIDTDSSEKPEVEKVLQGSEEEKRLLEILESWDYSDWQPKDQLDNTKAFVLMFIRELKNEIGSVQADEIFSSLKETRMGEMNRAYQSEDFNFELNFPENWFIKKDENNLLLQKPESLIISGLDLAGASPRISLRITVREADVYREDIMDKFFTHWKVQEKTLISGQDASFITIGGYGNYSCSIIFTNNKFLYEINFGDGCFKEEDTQSSIKEGDIKLEKQEHLKMEKEILSTFRFLE